MIVDIKELHPYQQLPCEIAARHSTAMISTFLDWLCKYVIDLNVPPAEQTIQQIDDTITNVMDKISAEVRKISTKPSSLACEEQNSLSKLKSRSAEIISVVYTKLYYATFEDLLDSALRKSKDFSSHLNRRKPLLEQYAIKAGTVVLRDYSYNIRLLTEAYYGVNYKAKLKQE